MWESESIAPPFFTSELDGDKWSASYLGRFTPREKSPPYPLIGVWVGPSVGLDAAQQRKISSLCRETILAVQIVARRYTDWSHYCLQRN
jgi:hypothetical protein